MSAAAAPAPIPQGGWRARVQKVGGNLAAMVMPNIGAFLAWGLLTALFIETGWLPNESFAEMVGPMINFLLPILIGYTGGRLVHDQRGAVIGAVATIGVIVGTDIPQFLGAMLIGPLAAWLLKKLDDQIVHRIRTGFEMLVNNFTLGILGLIMALVGYVAIGPVVTALSEVLGNGVQWLIDNSLLPLASVIVEPAKVLFLNNAINHGVFGPLGVIQAEEIGKSILFMMETNPGPGLGVLIAFWLAGPKAVRPTVPAAAVIHFLGGIHEIYFPYVLMKPQMIIAAIAGGMTGVATFMVTGVGLVATPAPGSIFAYLAVTPRGDYLGVLLGVLLSTVVSAVVGTVVLRLSRTEAEKEDLAAAAQQSRANKGVKPATSGA